MMKNAHTARFLCSHNHDTLAGRTQRSPTLAESANPVNEAYRLLKLYQHGVAVGSVCWKAVLSMHIHDEEQATLFSMAEATMLQVSSHRGWQEGVCEEGNITQCFLCIRLLCRWRYEMCGCTECRHQMGVIHDNRENGFLPYGA